MCFVQMIKTEFIIAKTAGLNNPERGEGFNCLSQRKAKQDS